MAGNLALPSRLLFSVEAFWVASSNSWPCLVCSSRSSSSFYFWFGRYTPSPLSSCWQCSPCPACRRGWMTWREAALHLMGRQYQARPWASSLQFCVLGERAYLGRATCRKVSFSMTSFSATSPSSYRASLSWRHYWTPSWYHLDPRSHSNHYLGGNCFSRLTSRSSRHICGLAWKSTFTPCSPREYHSGLSPNPGCLSFGSRISFALPWRSCWMNTVARGCSPSLCSSFGTCSWTAIATFVETCIRHLYHNLRNRSSPVAECCFYWGRSWSFPGLCCWSSASLHQRDSSRSWGL